MTRSGSTLALRAAAATAALASVFLAAEALLRHFDLPRFDACSATADFAREDPELGFAGAPGGIVAGRQLNEMGLRGPLVPQPKPADRRRILYLGDSTAFGLGLPLAESFAARATALVEESGAVPAVDYVIGAFPGYSTYHSRILLDRLLPLEPDLVVFYVGARNDPNRHRYFRDADIPVRLARVGASWHRIRLLRLLEVAQDRLYKSLLRKVLGEDSRARVPLEEFRANVGDMLDRAALAGARSLIVVPPLSETLAEAEPHAAAYREALAEIGSDRRLTVVSLESAFAAIPAAEAYFPDGYHFAARGHALAAREIAAAIRADRLLDGNASDAHR